MHAMINIRTLKLLFLILTVTAMQGSFAEAKEGKELFQKYCTSCHGTKGQGAKGPALKKEGLLVTVEQQYFINTMKYGRKTLGCPTFKNKLKRSEMEKLASYIKSWQKGELLDAPLHKVSPATSEKGEALFALCGGCHGLEGEGAMGPPLMDRGLLKSISDGDLRRTIMYGRPGTPMKGHLEGMGGLIVLSMNEIDTLIAYIRHKEKGLKR